MQGIHIPPHFSASTGEELAVDETGGSIPWFAPDGHDVWCAQDNDQVEVWRFGGGGGRAEVFRAHDRHRMFTSTASLGFIWWLPRHKRLVGARPRRGAILDVTSLLAVLELGVKL